MKKLSYTITLLVGAMMSLVHGGFAQEEQSPTVRYAGTIVITSKPHKVAFYAPQVLAQTDPKMYALCAGIARECNNNPIVYKTPTGANQRAIPNLLYYKNGEVEAIT